MSAHDEQQAKILAETIADELFINGFGERASRLMLVDATRDLGGWCRDAVVQRIAAALRASPETGWLPMETAPKDGTPVLIGWYDDEGVWQSRCAWFEREFAVEGYAEDEAQATIWKQAWTDNRVASFGYEEVWEYEPTHWQPLPPAPPEVGSSVCGCREQAQGVLTPSHDRHLQALRRRGD